MSSVKRHIIGTKIVELKLSNTENSQNWQQKVSDLCQGSILDVIDQYFTEFSKGGEVKRIDSIELDLGTLPVEHFEQVFSQRFKQELYKTLQTLIQKPNHISDKPEKEQLTSSLELVNSYLQYGSLPWWVDTAESGIVQKNIQLMLRKQPQALKQLLNTLLLQNNANKRFVATLSSKERKKLTLALWKEQLPPGQLEFWLKHWPPALSKLLSISIEHSVNIFWQALMISLVSLQEIGSRQNLSIHLIHQLSRMLMMSINQLHNSMATIVNFPSSLMKDVADSQKKDKKINLRKNLELNLEEIDEIFINNAGVVLLFPFLPNFFNITGCIAKGIFIDEAAKSKAVSLLNYLVTGLEDFEEYQVPLLKLICGLRLEDNIIEKYKVTEEDKKEGTQLLQSVVEHATVLKNMSIDGFRASFLIRKGVLKARDGNWLVQVEGASYDVVMDKFPWSFNLFKLKWLDRLIFVEW